VAGLAGGPPTLAAERPPFELPVEFETRSAAFGEKGTDVMVDEWVRAVGPSIGTMVMRILPYYGSDSR
jgi:hypothetical protein